MFNSTLTITGMHTGTAIYTHTHTENTVDAADVGWMDHHERRRRRTTTTSSSRTASFVYFKNGCRDTDGNGNINTEYTQNLRCWLLVAYATRCAFLHPSPFCAPTHPESASFIHPSLEMMMELGVGHTSLMGILIRSSSGISLRPSTSSWFCSCCCCNTVQTYTEHAP